MAFPVELAVVLSGATRSQLATWRREPALLIPEVAQRPKALYSFRDVVALRTMVYLRREVPLQRIRTAFRSLDELDLTEHPSNYQLTSDGDSVFLVDETGATDLVRRPGQQVIANLGEVFEPFRNFKGARVVNFIHPRKRLDVQEGRIGGWPTIGGTRVPYDTIANLVAGGEVGYDEVSEYFPTVSADDVEDAVDFDKEVSAVAG